MLKIILIVYKKDIQIENPKKFQRHVNDISGDVLFKRGYYFNGRFSQFPYLKSNGIANIADFQGVLCYVKEHRNYNLIARIVGICLTIFGFIHWFYPTITSHNFYWDPFNFGAWILIGTGLFLIFFKFGKDICIEIKLVGESYRTDIEKETDSIEYLNVRSTARLTVQGSTLDPKKILNYNDRKILQKDGEVLIKELAPFLEKFKEKTKIQN